MPKPKSAERWNSGYEKGSIASQMTDQERKEFRAWLKVQDQDLRAQIRGWRFAGYSVPGGQGDGGFGRA